MNKFLACVLVVSSSTIFTPLYGAPPFESIRDLSEPFKRKGKFYLSPVIGAHDSLIRTIRFHGHYGPAKSPFPRVRHNQLKEEDTPQEAIAALIQRLFPSPLHDALVPNNLQQDDLKKWLKPECIAGIFNYIDDHEKFSRLSEDERLPEFVRLLAPNVYWTESIKSFQQAKITKTKESTVLLSRLEGREPLKFARLLDQAIIKSRTPNPEDQQIYHPHIVESALLTYMWRQAPNKLALQPYYETLSKDLVDKTIPVDFYSSYMKEDYFALKSAVDSGTLPIEEFMDNPEKMTLLALGCSYYEDPLPPVTPYGPVKFTDPDGESFSFTNCGENGLMQLFNMVMFDPDSRLFSVSRLEDLKEKYVAPLKEFVDFYAKT